MKKQPPVHPGEILLEEFAPLNISQYRLAKDLSVPPRRINEIVQGKRGLYRRTPPCAYSRYFGNSAEFWLNLQNHYDIEVLRDELGGRLKLEVKVYREAARKVG